MSILDIAKYVVSKQEKMTHLKLQKLLYYSKVWGLVSGNTITSEPFLKWTWGPVSEKVWHAFKHHGGEAIPKTSEPVLLMNPEKKAVLDFVLECYSPFDAVTLSAMSHQDTPWTMTPKNQVISDNAIKDYYSSLPFAKNFPLASGKPFYPVETDYHYAFIFDMDPDEAAGLVFPSYHVYMQQLLSTQEQLKKLLSGIGGLQ